MKNETGFTLIEALISISILLVLAVGSFSANSITTSSISLSQNRSQANLLAQETIDAVQSIRAGNFLSLTNGTFHPVMGPSAWSLSPGSETIGKFTRSIIISPVFRAISCFAAICDIVSAGGIIDNGSFKVKVIVSWNETSIAKEIVLATLVSYWR